MASETINYKLKKPTDEDFYDIADHNSNMDKVDTLLKERADAEAEALKDYDLEETYAKNDICKSEGNFYVSLKDGNKGKALTLTTYWKKWGSGSDIVPVPTAETQILISDMSEPNNAKYKTVGFAAAKAKPVSEFKAAISDKWQKLKEPFDSDLLAYIDFEDGLVPKVGDFTITQEGTEETQGYFGKGRGINKGSSECYLSTNAKVAPMSGPVSFRFKIKIIDLMAKASLITTVASWVQSSTGFTMVVYNGHLEWGYLNNSAACFDTINTSPISSKGWHDIICSWTGDKTINGVKIYIDGLLYTQATATGLNIGGSGNLQIGKLISASKVNRYEIDEIEVYNTVKTPSDFAKNDKINLSWLNPANITFNQDTVIRRSDENYPATISDGIEVYRGNGENCIDASADTSINQYYSAFGDNGIMPSDAANVDSNGGEEQLVNYTMLYDQGDECQSVTGGWETKKIGSPTITKNLHNVYMRSSGTGNDCQINTTNKVNLSGYNQIHARTKITITGNAETYLAVSDNYTDWARLELTKAKINVTQDGVLKLDLADLGQKILKLEADQSGGINETYVYNLFAVKQDDYRTLCTKAGVTAPATLNELIADTVKVTTIFASDKAISYMIARCTGDFMVAVLNDSSARALLKASPHLNKIIANIHWAKFMMILAPELLNYTMLYDRGKNNEINPIETSMAGSPPQGFGTVTFGADDVKMHRSGFASWVGIGTKLQVDSAVYKRAAVLIDYSLTGSNGAVLSLLSEGSTNGYPHTGFQISRITSGAISRNNHFFVDKLRANGHVVFYAGGTGSEQSVADSCLKIFVVFKSDNWKAWATIGGIIGFSDLETLLADSTAVNILMANEVAAKYLMGCTGELMVAICNSETAMNALVDNIAYDYVFKHPVWFKFMTMCPVSLAAMDSVARTVPTMTSNTAPSGVAFSSSNQNASYLPFKAFNKVNATDFDRWTAEMYSAPPHHVGYDFTRDVCVYRVSVLPLNAAGAPKTIQVIGSDQMDLSNPDVMVTTTMPNMSSNLSLPPNYANVEITLPNSRAHRYWAVRILDNWGTEATHSGIWELQFYGKAVE